MFWFPYSRPLLKLWLQNYKKNIGPVCTRINEPAADIAKAEAAADKMLADLNNAEEARLEWERLNAIARTSIAENGLDIRNFIKRLKGNPLLTATDQEGLQIVTTAPVTDVDGYKPMITGKQTGVVLHISFKKHGADGMNIYVRLKGEQAFKLAGHAKHAPYVYTPVPVADGTSQGYEFYAMPTLANVEVGLRSETLLVTFNG